MSVCACHPSPSQLPRPTPLRPHALQSSYSQTLRWGHLHPHVASDASGRSSALLGPSSPSGPVGSLCSFGQAGGESCGPAGWGWEESEGGHLPHPYAHPFPLPYPRLTPPAPSRLPTPLFPPSRHLTSPSHLPTPAPWPSAASSLSTHTLHTPQPRSAPFPGCNRFSNFE